MTWDAEDALAAQARVSAPAIIAALEQEARTLQLEAEHLAEYRVARAVREGVEV